MKLGRSLLGVRSVLVVVAVLTGLGAPSTGAGAADLPTYDLRVGSALDRLDAIPATADLRVVLATNRVSIQFVPLMPGVYARYNVQRRTIEIDRRWREAEPDTLAAVIAHEATHAQDAVSGYLARGGAAACLDSEVRAFRTSASFWLETFGAAGKPDASGDLERQLNQIAQREAWDPVGLESLVQQTYTGQCAH